MGDSDDRTCGDCSHRKGLWWCGHYSVRLDSAASFEAQRCEACMLKGRPPAARPTFSPELLRAFELVAKGFAPRSPCSDGSCPSCRKPPRKD